MTKKTLFDVDDADVVAFQYGAPGKDLLPSDVFAAASAAFFGAADTNHTFLQYGPAKGDGDFLNHLRDFLAEKYSDASLRHDSLCLTSGASQSFFNIIALLTTKETKIIVESPTYFLALNVLQDHGFNKDHFINVPTDSDGLDVDHLESVLASATNVPGMQKQPHKFTYLLYLVPTFSNPTGRTTSLERRHKIIQLARKHDILVVCDDVYQMLPLTNAPPPTRLVSLDTVEPGHLGNVISNNSFSKILAPGLRLGWMEASPAMVSLFSRSGLMNSGGSPNHLVSGLVLSVMQRGGLDAHVARLRGEYADRMNAMCDYLEINLPGGVKVERPKGGFFIWVILPKGEDAFEIQQANQHRGMLYHGKALTPVKMSYAPGRLFSVDPRAAGNCIRLTFAFYPKQKLLEGCERLCRLLKEAL
ncbi:hypothetical protein HDU98_005416 [Podochytrium sp. JEL0797]|nr:hypothetical protein HDU98_005416 [Podochytrium sp. JEL0797]